jgi:hypothetical protein
LKLFVRSFAFVCAACAVAIPVFAQETSPIPPAISTERPTAGPSPDLIPRGSVQVENGAGVTRQSGVTTLDLPENLLRYGLTERLEVRFLASNMVYQTTAGHFESQDLAFSAKLLVAGPNRLAPKSAILSLSVPTGGAAFTSNSTDPTLDLIWTQAIPHGYFLNQVAQVTLTTLNSARRPLWSPGIAGGKALTANLTVFGEYAPNVLPDSSRNFLIDSGLALVRHDVQQWDIRAGMLSDSGGLHPSILIGYSIRRDGFFSRGR